MQLPKLSRAASFPYNGGNRPVSGPKLVYFKAAFIDPCLGSVMALSIYFQIQRLGAESERSDVACEVATFRL